MTIPVYPKDGKGSEKAGISTLMDRLCYNKRNRAVGRLGMNTTLTIQEKLKDLRVEHGLTLEQLADQTGLSKSALGKYENDNYKDISPLPSSHWQSFIM